MLYKCAFGRRQFLLAASVAIGAASAGCIISGSDDLEGEPVIDTTITDETEWRLNLEEGQRIRIVAEDNDGTAFIAYRIETPRGLGTRQMLSSVDRTHNIDHTGEHTIIMDPSRETHVRIYVG